MARYQSAQETRTSIRRNQRDVARERSDPKNAYHRSDNKFRKNGRALSYQEGMRVARNSSTSSLNQHKSRSNLQRGSGTPLQNKSRHAQKHNKTNNTNNTPLYNEKVENNKWDKVVNRRNEKLNKHQNKNQSTTIWEVTSNNKKYQFETEEQAQSFMELKQLNIPGETKFFLTDSDGNKNSKLFNTEAEAQLYGKQIQILDAHEQRKAGINTTTDWFLTDSAGNQISKNFKTKKEADTHANQLQTIDAYERRKINNNPLTDETKYSPVKKINEKWKGGRYKQTQLIDKTDIERSVTGIPLGNLPGGQTEFEQLIEGGKDYIREPLLSIQSLFRDDPINRNYVPTAEGIVTNEALKAGEHAFDAIIGKKRSIIREPLGENVLNYEQEMNQNNLNKARLTGNILASAATILPFVGLTKTATGFLQSAKYVTKTDDVKTAWRGATLRGKTIIGQYEGERKLTVGFKPHKVKYETIGGGDKFEQGTRQGGELGLGNPVQRQIFYSDEAVAEMTKRNLLAPGQAERISAIQEILIKTKDIKSKPKSFGDEGFQDLEPKLQEEIIGILAKNDPYTEPIHGSISTYGHLSAATRLKAGDTVKAGDIDLGLKSQTDWDLDKNILYSKKITDEIKTSVEKYGYETDVRIDSEGITRGLEISKEGTEPRKLLEFPHANDATKDIFGNTLSKLASNVDSQKLFGETLPHNSEYLSEGVKVVPMRYQEMTNAKTAMSFQKKGKQYMIEPDGGRDKDVVRLFWQAYDKGFFEPASRLKKSFPKLDFTKKVKDDSIVQNTSVVSTTIKNESIISVIKTTGKSKSVLNISTGNKGSTGSLGSRGSTGSLGSRGSTGSLGSRGSTGSLGSRGSTGSLGSRGSTGSIGSKGSTGSIGSKGSTGSIGSKGSTGSLGSRGSTGSLGSRGSKGSKGSTGSRGSRGNRGSRAGRSLTSIIPYSNKSSILKTKKKKTEKNDGETFIGNVRLDNLFGAFNRSEVISSKSKNFNSAYKTSTRSVKRKSKTKIL